MALTLVKRVLDRWNAVKSGRGYWESHWQDLADAMHPRRADFTRETTAGEKRTQYMYDSAPMLAARGLAGWLDGMLPLKSDLTIKFEDENLNDQDFAKLWIEETERRVRNALYNPKARFTNGFSEGFMDLGVLGTGAIFMGERRGLGRLIFRALHLKNTWICLNEDGAVDTVFMVEKLAARQAMQRFGEDKLGEKTKEALKANHTSAAQKDKKFPFLQVVQPREDRDTTSPLATNMPFASTVIDVDSEHLVGEGGFHEFPFAVMRWDTTAGEDYGRSPGMIALPDSLTLHQMGRTLLKAGHIAVDPPWLAPSDGIASTLRTYPGGVTYFDSEAFNNSRLRQPVTPLVSGADMPLGLEMQQDRRDQVFAAFLRNVLNLPVEGPQMTATEVIERKQEFIDVVAPLVSRIEADGPVMAIERAYGILARAGALPPAPPELQNRPIKFEYASPVEKIRKQIEAVAFTRSIEIIGPMAEAKPDMLDHYDTDAIARDVPEAVGVPKRWMKPIEQVQAERKQREQAEQQAQAAATALAAAESAAKTAKDAGQATASLRRGNG